MGLILGRQSVIGLACEALHLCEGLVGGRLDLRPERDLRGLPELLFSLVIRVLLCQG